MHAPRPPTRSRVLLPHADRQCARAVELLHGLLVQRWVATEDTARGVGMAVSFGPGGGRDGAHARAWATIATGSVMGEDGAVRRVGCVVPRCHTGGEREHHVDADRV